MRSECPYGNYGWRKKEEVKNEKWWKKKRY
jgi:hypothetical protein